MELSRSREMESEESNFAALEFERVTVEEKREAAQRRAEAYQRVIAKAYNKHVRMREFKVEDLVLREVYQNTKNPREGKLGANWEGPYRIVEVVGKGAYKLETMDGREIANSWNARHLKKYIL